MMTNIVNFEALCEEMTGPLKQIIQPEQALKYVNENLSIGQRVRVELTNSFMSIASIRLAGDPLEVVVDFRDKDDASFLTSMWPIYQTELAPADPFPDSGWGGSD